LYCDKFRSFSEVQMKVSPEVLPMLPQTGNLKMGSVITNREAERAIPQPKAAFHGRVYLMVDNGTFSSATDFAAMFRDYKVGTILGYETGGVPTSFGDVYAFTLKNSGISAGVSWKHFAGPRPRPGDDRHGILPDIPMNRQTLAGLEAEPDPVLAYTLRVIRERRK
jgi:C-terminal processing protease CtpA/Prc